MFPCNCFPSLFDSVMGTFSDSAPTCPHRRPGLCLLIAVSSLASMNKRALDTGSNTKTNPVSETWADCVSPPQTLQVFPRSSLSLTYRTHAGTCNLCALEPDNKTRLPQASRHHRRRKIGHGRRMFGVPWPLSQAKRGSQRFGRRGLCGPGGALYHSAERLLCTWQSLPRRANKAPRSIEEVQRRLAIRDEDALKPQSPQQLRLPHPQRHCPRPHYSCYTDSMVLHAVIA
jgi:hypothetical protein